MLFDDVVKLAYENEDIKKDLIPVLKKYAEDPSRQAVDQFYQSLKAAVYKSSDFNISDEREPGHVNHSMYSGYFYDEDRDLKLSYEIYTPASIDTNSPGEGPFELNLQMFRGGPTGFGQTLGDGETYRKLSADTTEISRVVDPFLYDKSEQTKQSSNKVSYTKGSALYWLMHELKKALPYETGKVEKNIEGMILPVKTENGTIDIQYVAKDGFLLVNGKYSHGRIFEKEVDGHLSGEIERSIERSK